MTPGSPAPESALEPDQDPDPDPGHPVFLKPFAMPAAAVPDTAKPFVKLFAKPVTRPPYKVGPLARAEPASTALATTMLASTKNGEVPRAAIDDCSRPAVQEFGVRPPAKPNFLLASAAAAGSSVPTAGTKAARPPAKPNFAEPAASAADYCTRKAARPPAKPNWPALALSLPTTDNLLPLPFIQLLAPLDAITSRSQLRCCVALMGVWALPRVRDV